MPTSRKCSAGPMPDNISTRGELKAPPHSNTFAIRANDDAGHPLSTPLHGSLTFEHYAADDGARAHRQVSFVRRAGFRYKAVDDRWPLRMVY